MGAGKSREMKVVTLVHNLESHKTSVSKVRLDKKISWLSFRKTLDTVFPELAGQQISVVWNSSDKRTCKVSSDEELIVAVESMADKVEFTIKRLKTGDDQTDKSKAELKKPDKEKQKEVHRPSLRNNPHVARVVAPLKKIFSQKDIKEPDQPTEKSSKK